MKKKLFLLAAFIALNVAAQTSKDSSIDLNTSFLAHANSLETPRKASVALKIDAREEVLKVRATLPINELSINNLYGKKLIGKRNSNTLQLSTLPRGVYELEVKLEGATFRKRIILQ